MSADELLGRYTLEVEPALFGRLRLRCWSEEENRPSRYSNAVRLPKFVTGSGVGDGLPQPKDVQQQLVEAARRDYFARFPQHVTDRAPPGPDKWGSCTLLADSGVLPAGRSVEHRIGNQASLNVWGGDSMPSPPPRTEEEVARCMPASAPVPYDVPALPIADIPGLEDAGAALARVYRQMGAAGGGGGQLLGLRIDHVLHAIMGTPITEFRYSPRRTQSTLEQPLIALCEVVYADVLLPLLDTAVVCRSELGYVDEKVAGIVAQLVTLRAHHDFIEQHILEILGVLQV